MIADQINGLDPLGRVLDPGPVVPVGDTLNTVDPGASVRRSIENATRGNVPAQNLSAYPDYLQRFAKFYVQGALNATLALALRDLPQPEPGAVPGVVAATDYYVDTHTSPATLVQFSRDVFPNGFISPDVGGPVNDAAGLDILNTVRNAPDIIFGPPEQQPKDGMGPFSVNLAVKTADDAALSENSPGNAVARGVVRGLLGTSTANTVFGVPGSVNQTAAALATVRCFEIGGPTAWAACGSAAAMSAVPNGP